MGATKVDYHGREIKGVAEWRAQNPKALLFDSKLEQTLYKLLEESGITFVFKPVYTLQEKFSYEGENIRAITMEPDFYLQERDLIVDTKGYANDVYPLKAKLLKHFLYRNNLSSRLVNLSTPKEVKDFVLKLKLNLPI